jgi:hypothetical protein
MRIGGGELPLQSPPLEFGDFLERDEIAVDGPEHRDESTLLGAAVSDVERDDSEAHLRFTVAY